MPMRPFFYRDPFGQLRGEMGRLFESALPGFAWEPSLRRRGFPAVNIWEDGGNLYAEAELPGLESDGIEVHVVGDELTIKGHRKPLEDKGLSYHRQERGTGEFARVFTLPVEIDADKVQAVLKDGVLTVTLPKAEAAKARTIAVKTK